MVLLGLPRVPLGPWVLLVRLGLCYQPRLVLWAPLVRLGLYRRRRLVRLGRLVPGSPCAPLVRLALSGPAGRLGLQGLRCPVAVSAW